MGWLAHAVVWIWKQYITFISALTAYTTYSDQFNAVSLEKGASMHLSLCINVVWDLIRNDKYISIHVSCCKVSLLISSTSTSSFVNGIMNIKFFSKMTSQNSPSECLKSTKHMFLSVSPHCSLLTFTSESHHGLLALGHIHACTHTGQCTFSPSTRPVAFRHKTNSQNTT